MSDKFDFHKGFFRKPKKDEEKPDPFTDTREGGEPDPFTAESESDRSVLEDTESATVEAAGAGSAGEDTAPVREASPKEDAAPVREASPEEEPLSGKEGADGTESETTPVRPSDTREEEPSEPDTESASAESASAESASAGSASADAVSGDLPSRDGSGQEASDTGSDPVPETAQGSGQEAGSGIPFRDDSTSSSGPSAESREHDFDDEPKFDTQTGELLSKPKSKIPGILLTIAVTAGVAGAITAAFRYKDAWKSVSDDAQIETERSELNQAAEGSTEAASETDMAAETEGAAGPEMVSESETAGTGMTEAVPGTSAETEEQTEKLTEEQTEKPTEEQTEQQTEEKKVPDLSDAIGKDAVSLNTSLDVSQVAEATLPSIVSVTSQSVEKVQDFFYGEQQIAVNNVGSGIIVDEDEDNLYIVTDAYLTAHAQDLTVGFSSGEKDTDQDGGAGADGQDSLADAEILGADAGTELAVLSVKKSSLDDGILDHVKTAILGDSDSIRIGERAVAIGDSLGYGQSVTQGIISAKERTMRTQFGVHDYLQTDASINYGNYGGALLNLDGEVIGINAGKVIEEATEGMGYALPINDAKKGIARFLPDGGEQPEESGTAQEEAVPQTEGDILSAGQESEKESEIPSSSQESEKESEILSSGEGSGMETEASGQPGLLGVHVVALTEENQIIYRAPAGIYVAEVDAGSGADAAGIRADDIITAVDGGKVTTVEELRDALSDTKAGDKVEVEIYRADKEGKYENAGTVEVVLQ